MNLLAISSERKCSIEMCSESGIVEPFEVDRAEFGCSCHHGVTVAVVPVIDPTLDAILGQNLSCGGVAPPQLGNDSGGNTEHDCRRWFGGAIGRAECRKDPAVDLAAYERIFQATDE